MLRRDFLRSAAVSAAAVALATTNNNDALAQQAASTSSNPPTLPRRPYGKAAIPLSIIGLGGIVVRDVEQDRANRIVALSVERGVNYFDVAPNYGDAQEKLGPALQPYRKNCFLSCKTARRDRASAEADLKRSFELLRTDWFDLYQLHAISNVARDVDAAFMKGGVMELLIEGRKDGRFRHLGFSAHSIEAAMAALDRYDFDSVMFPVNFTSWFKGDFGPQIMEKAIAKGASCLALKAGARQTWSADHPDRTRYAKCWYEPLTDPHEIELSLRFTLSQPVTSALPPGEEQFYLLALDAAMRFKPLDDAAERELRQLAAALNPLFRTRQA